MDHARKLKFNSYVHLPSINNMFQYRYSVQCRRSYYFRAWVLYFRFGTCYNVNIKQLCSSRILDSNLQIWSRLGDFVRCMLSFGLRSSIS